MRMTYKDWDSKLARKYDPIIRYGLFGEEDDNEGLGGGGADNESSGSSSSGAGGQSGIDGLDALGAAASRYSGGAQSEGGQVMHDDAAGQGYQNYTNTSNQQASDPLGDIFAGLAEAEVRAAEIMAAATEAAAAQIKKGMEEAAKATIESAKIASAAVLKQADISDKRIREFWNAARNDLKPIIDQGRFASDEMASMLGIKDSNGRLVEFDDQDTLDTPRAKFAMEWGNRALQNSAVGTSQSGSNARATIEFGQGLAMQQFDKRLEQLGVLAQGGWNAARDQANAATQTGNTFAQVHSQAGSDLAGIQNTKATNLSNIYTQGSSGIANAYLTGAQSRVGLITGLATAGANLQIAQMNNEAQLAAYQQSQSNQQKNSIWGAIGTIGGAAIGGPLGGFIGGLFS